MSFNDYDLTGTLYPRYKIFRVFTNQQVLNFGEPVFLDTLVLTNVGTGAITTDYTVKTSDKAVDAISEGKLKDSTFNRVLVHSVSLNGYVSGSANEYTIRADYNAFSSTGLLEGDDYGPEYSPELMRRVLDSLDFLLAGGDSVLSGIGESLTGMLLLEEDLTGLASSNYIKDEVHIVNTAQHISIISPAGGPFYEHDLVVKVGSSGAVLTRGTHYQVIAPDIGRIKAAYHTSGVYQYILLLTPLVGQVIIEYRAFGGVPTVADVKILRDALIGIISQLNTLQGLTPDNVGDTPIIQDIISRIERVEDQLGSYPTVDYVIPQVSPNTPWYPVLYLPHGPWSTIDPVPESTYGKFRCIMSAFNYSFDVEVDYNVNRVEVIRAKIVRRTQDTYTPETYKNFESFINTRIRAVYDPTDLDKGIVLLMRITTPEANTKTSVTLRMQDLTGAMSPWVLYESGVLTDGTQSVTLPDDNSIAMSSSPEAEYPSAIATMGTYPLWVGNFSMVNLTVGAPEIFRIRPTAIVCSPSSESRPQYRNYDLYLKDIKGFRVTAYNRVTGVYVSGEAGVINGSSESTLSADIAFGSEDLCVFRMEFADTGGALFNRYAIKMKPMLGSRSEYYEIYDLCRIDAIV